MDQPIFSEIKRVCDEFCIKGTLVSYDEMNQGNVNNTYKVNFTQPDGNPKSYVVQRLNTFVFKQPIQVMENIDKVTEHIRAKKTGKHALHFHHTRERNTYVIDEYGFWRLFNYIPSKTYDLCDDLGVIRNAGNAFGEFQMLLGDFDAKLLHETIPFFHDTERRYEKLVFDAKKDPNGLLESVMPEYEWLLSVRDKACTLTRMFKSGKLPLRVTHNDTKINNVLFDKDGTDALVVIDLDTVMPGLVGNDFGDAIRFAANYVEEDSPDFEQAGVNMEVFRAFSEGFLAQTSGTLTKKEIDTLAISCFAMSCELATRFLDDYILGNPYFKIKYSDHNLVRTRCQIALAEDMLEHLDEMQAIIEEYTKG